MDSNASRRQKRKDPAAQRAQSETRFHAVSTVAGNHFKSSVSNSTLAPPAPQHPLLIRRSNSWSRARLTRLSASRKTNQSPQAAEAPAFVGSAPEQPGLRSSTPLQRWNRWKHCHRRLPRKEEIQVVRRRVLEQQGYGEAAWLR